MLKLLQYCNYIIIVVQIKLMLLLLLLLLTHQHGIASTVSLTITERMRKVLAIPRSSRGVFSVCFSSDIVVLLFMTLFKH